MQHFLKLIFTILIFSFPAHAEKSTPAPDISVEKNDALKEQNSPDTIPPAEQPESETPKKEENVQSGQTLNATAPNAFDTGDNPLPLVADDMKTAATTSTPDTETPPEESPESSDESGEAPPAPVTNAEPTKTAALKSDETKPSEHIELPSGEELAHDSVKAIEKVENSLEGIPPEVANNPLIADVAQTLDVSDKQASGGTGAMLAMAYQTLDATQAANLLKVVPHITQLTAMIPGDYGSSISNVSTLSEVFSVIGLSPTMIQKYSKVIRDYLKKNGASEELLNELTKIWAY